jgi:hypothetical protein
LHVTVDKTLTVQPALGSAPSVRGLFAASITTRISLIVQYLAGLNPVRTILALGGYLSLTELNNKFESTGSSAAVEFTAGNGAGVYRTVAAFVSGNTISVPTGGSCIEGNSITGVLAGFTATMANDDITVDASLAVQLVNYTSANGRTGAIISARCSRTAPRATTHCCAARQPSTRDSTWHCPRR